MFFFEFYLMLIGSFMLIIFLLIGVSFLTLMERKILGYIQFRKGPNKISLMGIFQPIADALKLFNKERMVPFLSNYLIYYICPILSLFLSLFIWMVMPIYFKLYSFNFGLLFFLCCISLGVYMMMIAGWSSNSNYSLLGSMRSVAQTISYEVSLSLILLSFIILIMSFDLSMFKIYQKYIWFFFICFPLMFCWFTSLLAETNRSPFDFSEGESELVSGFNVEYSSGGFAMIFMSEYSSILFMSMLFSIMFLGSNLYSIFFFFKISMLSFLFIWVRGAFPRFRYDKLMYLAWKSYLPLSLNYLFFFLNFKFYLYILLF